MQQEQIHDAYRIPKFQTEKRVRLHVSIHYGKSPAAFESVLTWKGKGLAKTESLFRVGSHSIGRFHDRENDERRVSIDETSFLESTSWKMSNPRNELLVRTFLNKHEMVKQILHYVRRCPHPTILTPLLEIGARFNDSFRNKIHSAALDALKSEAFDCLERQWATVGCEEGTVEPDLFRDGPLEDPTPGFCPAEFSSCVDCSLDMPSLDEPIVGGGGRQPIDSCFSRYVRWIDRCTRVWDAGGCYIHAHQLYWQCQQI